MSDEAGGGGRKSAAKSLALSAGSWGPAPSIDPTAEISAREAELIAALAAVDPELADEDEPWIAAARSAGWDPAGEGERGPTNARGLTVLWGRCKSGGVPRRELHLTRFAYDDGDVLDLALFLRTPKMIGPRTRLKFTDAQAPSARGTHP